jgi:hypothetical protein
MQGFAERPPPDEEPTPPTPVASPSVPPARLVIVENVYHQITGEQPTSLAPVAYSAPLASDEQPYQREFKVGPGWEMLDHGWLDPQGVSLLCLRNRPDQRNVRPNADEAAADAAKVIELAVVCPVTPTGERSQQPAGPRRTMHEREPAALAVALATIALVRPGATARFEPADVSLLAVRCVAGPCRASLALFPR